MRSTRFLGRAAAVAMILAGLCRPSSAATFSVNPTQIFLSSRSTSALLTLRNDSEEPLRFQLSVFAWSQSPSGEIELARTQDIVFFPALLTLQPKEERKIRVGSVIGAAAHEKTYRIFVEELPPSGAMPEGGAVRVLTKMGIPIFLRPSVEQAAVTLRELAVRNGTLQFGVMNDGNVHFVPQQIRVRGFSASAQALFEREVAGWYILAGGRRQFEVPLPASQCSGLSWVSVELGFGSTTLKETLQTPGGACAG